MLIPEEDLLLLKEYTVDYISLSYYNSRCVSADASLATNSGNLFASVSNPFWRRVSGDGQSTRWVLESH